MKWIINQMNYRAWLISTGRNLENVPDLVLRCNQGGQNVAPDDRYSISLRALSNELIFNIMASELGADPNTLLE